MRPHGNCHSVMVVTWKYHDPAHKPPPVLPNANVQKRGVFARFYLHQGCGNYKREVIDYNYDYFHFSIPNCNQLHIKVTITIIGD